MPPETPPEHAYVRTSASDDETFDSDHSISTGRGAANLDGAHSDAPTEELGSAIHERSRLLGETSGRDPVAGQGNSATRPATGPGYGSFADFIYTGKANWRSRGNGTRPATAEGQQDDGSPTMLNRSDTYAASLAEDSMIDGLLGRSKQRGVKHWFSSNPAIKQERSV
jgi:hypothetical protein